MNDLNSLSPSLQTSKTMSRHYIQMDTEKLCNTILGMSSKGNPVFELRSIQMKKPTKSGPGRGLHLVRIQTVMPYEINGEFCHPEIVIKNSYDGSSPFEVYIGIFRVFCSNGMIIGTKFGKVKFRHMGTPEEAAFLAATQLRNNLQNIVKVQSQLSERILSDDEMIEFAMKAAKLRWEAAFTEEDAKLLLEVARPEDEGSNLWLVMNRVQEKLMHGGIKSSEMKRTSKPVKNAELDLKVNTELFELASSYLDYEMVDDQIIEN